MRQEAGSLTCPISVQNLNWHNESFTSDWISSLLVLQDGSQALVDPNVPAPDASVMAPKVARLYEELFAIMLALNAKGVFSAAPADQEGIDIQAVAMISRIFVSEAMFNVSVVLLGLHLLVAMLYYALRPKRLVGGMPTTIGALLGYIDGSRACADFGDHEGDVKVGGRDNEKRNEERGKGERRYAFGRFVGMDGKAKVGIERAERVVLLGREQQSFELELREGRNNQDWI